MKKTIIFIMLAAAILSCAFSAGTDKPEWINSDVSTPEKYCVAAYAKMSKRQNSIRRAQAEAKTLFAENISTAITSIIEVFSAESDDGKNSETVDGFITLSKQYSNAVFRGAKQEAMWDDPDGGVWVLMSIPTEELEKAMAKAADEIWGNEGENESTSAQTANRMMHEAIEKYFGGEKENEDK